MVDDAGLVAAEADLCILSGGVVLYEGCLREVLRTREGEAVEVDMVDLAEEATTDDRE